MRKKLILIIIIIGASCNAMAETYNGKIDIEQKHYPMPKGHYSQEFLNGFCVAANAVNYYQNSRRDYPYLGENAKIIFTRSDGSKMIECKMRKIK